MHAASSGETGAVAAQAERHTDTTQHKKTIRRGGATRHIIFSLLSTA
jgi:hypothetical protein